MATTIGAQPVPEYLEDANLHRRLIARAVNFLTKGKLNITLDVTLNASSTTTTIYDARINTFSAIFPAMAQTSSAANALAAGIYVDTVLPPLGTTTGSAVIHHASNAATDQTLRFIIIG